MRNYPYFLLVSYLTALLFETIANTIGDGKLFQQEGWPIFFLVWYGALYSPVFLVLNKKPLWMPVLAGAIIGPVVEVVFFQRLNPLVDPLVYAVMFLVPFWVHHRYLVGKST
ncbi:MAG: hypothetical protein JXB14_01400 [Candidatus Altiarchaeota archaeon]|nr:hypothetical protein [Candidatus Altiarchaeota archaeon]